MAHIALIGGHGKVALLATPKLLARGHHVDSFVRNPDHSSQVRDLGATPVVADVEQLDGEGLRDALQGHDVVIWSAGAGGGSPERTTAVDRDAAIATIDAAAAAGARQFVMVSYFGAGPDHGVPEGEAFHAYAEAKAAADAHLRASDLDWVILGPSGLTDEQGTSRIELSDDGVEASQVSRADVAEVIAQVVGRADLTGRTLEFNNGPRPIDEALAGAGSGSA